MQKNTFKILIAVFGCMWLFFVSQVSADVNEDVAEVTEDLVNEGISADVVDDIMSGSPDTLGQRVDEALNSGTITEKQYQAVQNKFMSLPQRTRQAYKNAYDNGAADKVWDKAGSVAHGREGSRKDHMRDLREAGLSKEAAKERLQESERKDHLKDKREDVMNRREHMRDRRENIRDKKDEIYGRGEEGDRKANVRDRKEDIRDRRKDRKYRREKIKDKKGLRAGPDKGREIGPRTERGKARKVGPRADRGRGRKVGPVTNRSNRGSRLINRTPKKAKK